MKIFRFLFNFTLLMKIFRFLLTLLFLWRYLDFNLTLLSLWRYLVFKFSRWAPVTFYGIYVHYVNVEIKNVESIICSLCERFGFCNQTDFIISYHFIYSVCYSKCRRYVSILYVSKLLQWLTRYVSTYQKTANVAEIRRIKFNIISQPQLNILSLRVFHILLKIVRGFMRCWC